MHMMIKEAQNITHPTENVMRIVPEQIPNCTHTWYERIKTQMRYF